MNFCYKTFYLNFRLKKLIDENETETELKDELNETIELLENDTKTFEDLEFQYLEEETDWLARREEMHHNQKTLSRQINEKRKHIQSLETQSIDNQNAAHADTTNIQKDIQSMLKELNNHTEGLKTIEILLYELSGDKNDAQSESDEDLSVPISHIKRPHMNDIMSQSLFGSQEIFGTKKSSANDLMSRSVNENLISNKIEMLSFSDQPMTKVENENDYENLCNVDDVEKRDSLTSDKSNKSSTENAIEPQNGNGNMSQVECEYSTSINENSFENSSMANDDDECSDPLQNLKYNLSPPFEHKATKKLNESNGTKSANLNLSIESDDFEVNPLEKRVPSQDDIDRICKVTTNAPISTQGASFKVIESIKEIERNRQLLLTQQGK